MSRIEEPKGIGFFSVKTGETHYCKLEPTIAAYINSSDMGINASRGQDFGWRLDPEWVKRVKAFRRDRTQMQILSAANNGQKPTTIQILHYLYGEEVRAYQEDLEENENPYEDQYQDEISGRNSPAQAVETPVSLPDIPKNIGNTESKPSEEDDEEVDTDSAAEAATSDDPDTVNRDAGTGQFVSDEAAAADPDGTVTETVTKPKAKVKKKAQ